MDEFAVGRRRLIGAGALLAGAGALAASRAAAQPGGAAAPGWQPTPEALDSWLDKPGTRHRMVFDSVSADGGMEALGYANNFIHVNESDYGLTPQQLGVVVIFRHMSTPFGYNDAMWARHGRRFAEQMELKGKHAIAAATANPVLAKTAPDQPLPKGMEWAGEDSLTDLAAKGVRFAVCGLATKGIAGALAGKAGNAAAIEAELKANLAPGALIVPAGISAVNRAQEHGYSFAYIG
jgi:intracellular sulfur oxidation DsrE/DsrF family protein